MGRVPRSSLPDGYFHVFARGVSRRGPLFRDDADRSFFLELVWRSAAGHGWVCHAACVLGTHYHLVLETSQPQLSAGLQQLNWTYARHYNEKYGCVGHAFADRFGARSLAEDEYLYDACMYVVLNPVRAGLCDRVDEWPWSYDSFGLHAAA